LPAEAALVAYLDSVLTETAGTDLFEGPMPESPDNCIHVAHYDSQEAEDRVMAASLVNNAGLWPVSVQIMARNTNKATAEARARAAFDALDNLLNTTLSGVKYHSIEADGEPFDLGKDANERWRFVFNCIVRKARG
jgi:hypothetical protein